MFSKNRYGNSEWIKNLKSDEHYSGVYCVRNIDLGRDYHLNLVHQMGVRNQETQKYYEDDQFYTQHVVASEWFGKEKEEYLSGKWDAYFDYLMSRMNPNLPLIDVGCGAGWFVNYWNIGNTRFYGYGIEPSEVARRYSPDKSFIFENLSGFNKWLDGDMSYPPEFNILISLVLEHIPDPVKLIQQYLPSMGKNGTLTIVVPNDFSPLQQWLGSTHFIQDVHVNYFTPQSLLSAIYDALPDSDPVIQYEVKMSATFPMEIFELLGFHYIEDGDLGRKCHNFRLKFEKFFKKYAFKLYEKLYDKFGIGRELVFTIKKI